MPPALFPTPGSALPNLFLSRLEPTRAVGGIGYTRPTVLWVSIAMYGSRDQRYLAQNHALVGFDRRLFAGAAVEGDTMGSRSVCRGRGR